MNATQVRDEAATNSHNGVMKARLLFGRIAAKNLVEELEQHGLEYSKCAVAAGQALQPAWCARGRLVRTRIEKMKCATTHASVTPALLSFVCARSARMSNSNGGVTRWTRRKPPMELAESIG
jgi:hypothetical protein